MSLNEEELLLELYEMKKGKVFHQDHFLGQVQIPIIVSSLPENPVWYFVCNKPTSQGSIIVPNNNTSGSAPDSPVLSPREKKDVHGSLSRNGSLRRNALDLVERGFSKKHLVTGQILVKLTFKRFKNLTASTPNV